MKQLIVNFHGVGDPPPMTDASELKYWWDEKPFVAALDQIKRAREDAKLDVLITFDDGNMSDARIALPALLERKLTAEFFVCAGRVGKSNYLDRAALADLLDAGMSVGSHGLNHVDWRWTSDDELNAEIPGAIEKLEQFCGRPVTRVAIPFGSYDRRVIARLRQQKLDSIFTSDGGYSLASDWMRARNTLDRSQQNSNFLDLFSRADAPLAHSRRRLTTFYKTIR